MDTTRDGKVVGAEITREGPMPGSGCPGDEERMARWSEPLVQGSARRTADALESAVVAHVAGELVDDLAVLVVRVNVPSAGLAQEPTRTEAAPV